MTHDLCWTGNKNREKLIKWGNITWHSGKIQRCKSRSFAFCFVSEKHLTTFSNFSNSFDTESWWNSNIVWWKIIWKPSQSRFGNTKMRKEKHRIKIWNWCGCYKADGWLWELQVERRVLNICYKRCRVLVLLLLSPVSKSLGLL